MPTAYSLVASQESGVESHVCTTSSLPEWASIVIDLFLIVASSEGLCALVCSLRCGMWELASGISISWPPFFSWCEHA